MLFLILPAAFLGQRDTLHVLFGVSVALGKTLIPP
jgi:hypothetical protein